VGGCAAAAAPDACVGPCERGGGAGPTDGAARAHGVWAVAPRRWPPMRACGRCERGGGAGKNRFRKPLGATAKSQRWTPIIPASARHDLETLDFMWVRLQLPSGAGSLAIFCSIDADSLVNRI